MTLHNTHNAWEANNKCIRMKVIFSNQWPVFVACLYIFGPKKKEGDIMIVKRLINFIRDIEMIERHFKQDRITEN